MGTPAAGGQRPQGFRSLKSMSFHQVFIKFGEYVGGQNISTKFYITSQIPHALLNYGP